MKKNPPKPNQQEIIQKLFYPEQNEQKAKAKRQEDYLRRQTIANEKAVNLAREANTIARESNNIANKSNEISNEANQIAKKANIKSTASIVISIVSTIISILVSLILHFTK